MNKLEWVATLKNGETLRDDFDQPQYIKGLDGRLHEVKDYYIVDGERKIFGIDLVERVVVLSGFAIRLEVPPGDYSLVAFRYVRDKFGASKKAITHMGSMKRFCFGLQSTIDGRNEQILVYLNPDLTFSIGHRTK